MRRFHARFLIPLFAAAAPVAAAETLTYTYDARGRLVQVQRTGPVNKTTSYQFDKVNNRTSKTTS